MPSIIIDIILGILIFTGVVVSFLSIRKKKKAGSGCCGGCTGCAMAGSCKSKSDQE